MKNINYTNRDFKSIRESLIDYIRVNYPSVYSDFNDASIGMMMVELLSAVGDMLSHNTDRLIQENFIDFAQQRKSLLNIARTMGIKLPNKRPSVSIVDFTVTLPVKGDTFDLSYAPIILRGGEILGNGIVFQNNYDIDFSSPYNLNGFPNRKITPNRDSSGKIRSYDIVKQELVTSGTSTIFKRVVVTSDLNGFFSIILPDNDVLSIDRLIMLDGINYNRSPSIEEFYLEKNNWYEVPSLSESQIFTTNQYKNSDNPTINVGQWKRVSRKFVKEFTDAGFCKITFGNGEVDLSYLNTYSSDPNFYYNMLNDKVNNLSLGEQPKPSSTLFVKYKVGGGLNTNVGSNTINSVGRLDMVVNGSNGSQNTNVKSSLKVNNPIPSLGGKNRMTVEEIKQTIKFNYASQERCITANDYFNKILKMDSQFGVPYKFNVETQFNKINIPILGVDATGNLSSLNTSTLKENISEYLSKYRGINDYVSISDGKIINIQFEFDILVNRSISTAEIVSSSISNVLQLVDVNKLNMGQDLYLSSLFESINNVSGVLSVSKIKVFNAITDGYSQNSISQLVNLATREVDLGDLFLLNCETDEIFEVKYPSKDIKLKINFV